MKTLKLAQELKEGLKEVDLKLVDLTQELVSNIALSGQKEGISKYVLTTFNKIIQFMELKNKRKAKAQTLLEVSGGFLEFLEDENNYLWTLSNKEIAELRKDKVGKKMNELKQTIKICEEIGGKV